MLLWVQQNNACRLGLLWTLLARWTLKFIWVERSVFYSCIMNGYELLLHYDCCFSSNLVLLYFFSEVWSRLRFPVVEPGGVCLCQEDQARAFILCWGSQESCSLVQGGTRYTSHLEVKKNNEDSMAFLYILIWWNYRSDNLSVYVEWVFEDRSRPLR